MKTTKILITALTLGTTLVAYAPLANADTAKSVTNLESTRMGRKFGLYVGVVNEPAPSLLSANAGYNLTDFMRLSVGVGQLSMNLLDVSSSITTIGGGAKFMVPGWNLTPTVGINAATILYSGTPGLLSVGGFEKSGSHVYLSGGLDYQAPAGFNIGVGVNQSLAKGVGTSAYVNLGWFFDWLG